MAHDFLDIKVLSGASTRTKEIFSQYVDDEPLYKFVRRQRNITLVDDNFVPGEMMIMIAILAKFAKGAWQTEWQGWIPESDISWKVQDDE